MDIAASPIHVWCPQRFLISHASKSGSANQPPKASRSKLTSLIDRICRSNSRRSVPERGRGHISRPFWLRNYARTSVAASARKEGGSRGKRGGQGRARALWIHLGRDIIADVPSSFFGVPPSLPPSPTPSLISFGHPSNSLFFSLRLPLSLSLPRCRRRRVVVSSSPLFHLIRP